MTEFLIQPDDLELISIIDQFESLHPPIATLRRIEAEQTADSYTPYKTPCLTQYRAKRVSGFRPLDQIWWIVMHDTEGSTAQAAASWFANPNSAGSAHLCIDNNRCYKTLKDSEIPWGAPGANYHGYHIEQAGFASWSKLMWSRTHRRTMQRAAYKAAIRCINYKIPVRYCTPSMLLAGKKGITTHDNCSKAFGGSHYDPGQNYPMGLFIKWTSNYVDQMGGFN